MGKQFPNWVYPGALSVLVFGFTLVLLIAAARLFIPTNVAFGFGISTRFFTIAAVIFFTAVAMVCSLLLALQSRRMS